MAGPGPHPLRAYLARPVRVVHDRAGHPLRVNGRRVRVIREEWLVEEGWWSGSPVRRLYFEVVLDGGRNLTLFRSLGDEEWFEQRA